MDPTPDSISKPPIIKKNQVGRLNMDAKIGYISMPANGFLSESITYDFNSNPVEMGMNNYTVIGAVPNSGNYVIFMHNTQLSGTVTSVSVFEMTASLQTSSGTSQVMQPATVLATSNVIEYSTSNSTAYLQSMDPPYTVLGWGTSSIIILVVAIIAVFIVLLERGTLSLPTDGKEVNDAANEGL